MTEFVVSLLTTILGGVACHYIIKWLDSGDDDN
nr:MAG TPA: toxin [Caudoviricetes sp.]